MMNDAHGLILLVEDNSVQRRLYSDVLITQGYTVFAAENVKEAEQFLLSNMPSLIILDIMMPEIDGIEACPERRSKVLAYLRARANPETAVKTAPDPAHLHSNSEVASAKR